MLAKTMIVIPAIDIKDGRCVRLIQGRLEDQTVYSDQPAAVAEKWVQDGAERLHIVDLDAAFSRGPQAAPLIKEIIERVDVPIQVGGGIRDESTIRSYLDMGVAQVIIGTAAIQEPELVSRACKIFPGQISVAIDSRDGQVAIEGWTNTTPMKAVELAGQFEDSGVATIIFTDIQRDGMQTGPNIAETESLAKSVKIPVIASGGVNSIQDIQDLMPLAAVGVTGIITGKALYSGTLDLKDAIELTQTALKADG